MTRDVKAPEVLVGTVWFAWGKHYEITERYIDHEIVRNKHDKDRRFEIPTVRLHELNPDGSRKGKPHPFPVAAWRVAYYGSRSLAFGEVK